jgi:transcriptional regulator with XRE-family HTH domain
MPPKHPQFAAFLKEHREKQGLTQPELAEKVGVTKSNVYYWESGQGLPVPTVLEPLARTLRVSYEDLFVLAGYTHPEGLPSGEVYLRTMFPGASKRKLAEAERIYAELEADQAKRAKRKGRRT